MYFANKSWNVLIFCQTKCWGIFMGAQACLKLRFWFISSNSWDRQQSFWRLHKVKEPESYTFLKSDFKKQCKEMMFNEYIKEWNASEYGFKYLYILY